MKGFINERLFIFPKKKHSVICTQNILLFCIRTSLFFHEGNKNGTPNRSHYQSKAVGIMNSSRR